MTRLASDDENDAVERSLSRAPMVRMETGLGLPQRPITALFLHGEFDFACKGLVEDALAQLQTDVLVDLSWCTFIDSAVIASILAKHAALSEQGARLELIVPRSHPQLWRTFERLGARSILPVRDAPPSAAERDW
jgi:anti-anti-sigma regulatory factor